MENLVMVEAVVARDEAKNIFEAFRNERYAINPQISPKDAENDAIVAAFKNGNIRQTVAGKFERMFPGKISWR